MKSKKRLTALIISGIMVLLLCLPLSVVRAVNPGWPQGYKLTGPAIHGDLIVGWRQSGEDPYTGVVEAFLRVRDRLYMLEYTEMWAGWMLNNIATPAKISDWSGLLPAELARDFGFPDGTQPVIWEGKDVKGFEFRCLGKENGTCGPDPEYAPGCPPWGVWFCQVEGTHGLALDHKYLIHCSVTINWLVPW